MRQLLVQTRDRVRHAVAEMDASISKADARERGRQEHLALCDAIALVAEYAGQVLDRRPECPHAEYVGDRVAALVRRTVDGVRGTRPTLGVWNCGVRLERMEQHIETGRDVHLLGTRVRVERVDDSEHGLQCPRSDTRLCHQGSIVEDL
jgi:hypothetical protein